MRSGQALSGRQARERHNSESGVGSRTGLNKGGSCGVNGVETESGTVRVGGCHFPEVEALDGGVQGFGDEDGAGDAEVLLTDNQTRTTEIGRGTDALEDGGQRDKGLGIRVGEVVSAGGHWGDSGGADG